MSLIQFPTFLNVADLPLLQPLVEGEVRKATPLENISTCVAEYVTAAQKVETHRMIAFFQTHIPRKWIEGSQKHLPELRGCLEDNPPLVPLLAGALPMKNSPERKLMALAYMFFSFGNYHY